MCVSPLSTRLYSQKIEAKQANMILLCFALPISSSSQSSSFSHEYFRIHIWRSFPSNLRNNVHLHNRETLFILFDNFASNSRRVIRIISLATEIPILPAD